MARKTNRLTDKGIKALIAAGKPFEKADGAGLWLRMRVREGVAATPVFRFRYRQAAKARVMVLGSYGDISLAEARNQATVHRGRVSQKVDIAAEAKQRMRDMQAADERNIYTVTKLAEEFYRRRVQNKVKHPGIVRARIDKDIIPNIGRIPVTEVKPTDVQRMLDTVAQRSRTVANDVLRVTKRIFNEAVKVNRIENNPAAPFDNSDAGGVEVARDRALSRDELVRFFAAMDKTPGFSVENYHTFKLLLLLAVRKGELVMARVDEFDLKAAMWALPAERTKTLAAIDIPLPTAAVASLRELVRLGEGSPYLLPARKSQDRMLPHIHENTLNVALSKVRKTMGIKDTESKDNFTIHDLRRTARTQLSALKVLPHIAEKCLNHKVQGVAGTYDRHDYYDERRDALAKLAIFVEGCEKGTKS